MKVDVVLLKNEIEKNGGVSVVAKLADMSESTLYRRLSGDGTDFTIGEMFRLIKACRFGQKKTYLIFLCQQSQI